MSVPGILSGSPNSRDTCIIIIFQETLATLMKDACWVTIDGSILTTSGQKHVVTSYFLVFS